MNTFYSPIYKMEFRRLPLLALLFCLPLFSIPVRGQTNEISLDVPRIVPVSPAVTAMEKYQSYPIDHCTGVPNITIPLYEIVAGEVTIPVTLTYHASGLKPKEQSGIAGTGWTLNLEPSVSRQINGVADDAQYGWLSRFDSWNTPPASTPTDKLELFNYYSDRVDNKRDTQPDKFIYKLPHSGGSGYFAHYGTPLYTIPRNDDRVRLVTPKEVSITDEKGVQYSFKDTYETCDVDGTYDNYITRWLCNSIKSARNPKQELVSFSYRTIPYLMHPTTFYNLDSKLIFSDKEKSGSHRALMIEEYGHSYRYYQIDANPTGKPILKGIPQSSAGTYFPPSCSHISGYMSMALLTDTYFMGNRLSVSYKTVGNPTNATQSTVLDEIEVTNEHGERIRNIKFYITPCNDRTSLTKLDSVRVSAPGVEDRTYSFRYNSPSSVPSLNTTGVDHWGFYNGQGGEKTVPSLSHGMSLEVSASDVDYFQKVDYAGADREPRAEYAQTGVLNMITDPQGVQTSFTYEGNYGLFYQRDYGESSWIYLHPVGGIRVARIEAYDPHSRKRIAKAYKYGTCYPETSDHTPYWGGGAIKHIVTQRDYCSLMTMINREPSFDYLQYKESFAIYNSMPVSNITFNNGSAVMYNVVSEEMYGSADGVNLKTMYYYDVEMHKFSGNLEWDVNDPAGSVKDFVMNSITEDTKNLVRKEPFLAHELSDDFLSYPGGTKQRYGKLLYTEYFRNGDLMERVDNVYKDDWPPSADLWFTIPEKQLVIDPTLLSEGLVAFDDIFRFNSYAPDISCHRTLDKVIRKKYHKLHNQTTVSTMEQRYEYNYMKSMKPSKVTTVGSDNSITMDQYDYLFGYPAILSSHKRTEGDSFRESRVLFKPESCLPEKVQWRTDRMDDYRDEVVYRHYDGNNNATEIVGKDSIPISYLWSYQNRFPIARIENATIAEVYAALNMSSSEANAWAASATIPSGVWDKVNSLRGKLPGAHVTTYDYQPLHGVAIVVDPNNVTTKFSYDSYSRLTEGYFLDEDSRKVMLQKYIYHFGE